MSSSAGSFVPPLEERTRARHARPGRRRWIALIVVVVVVIGGLGAWAITRARSSDSSGAGHVLVYLTSGDLARADPDGSHAVPYTGLGFIGGGGVTASADGQTLVSPAGDIVTLRDGRPTTHTTTLYGPLSQHNGSVLSLQPFADQSRYVVFEEDSGDAAPGNPQIVPTAGGTAQALGAGDDYVGDPQQDAAWVSNPTGPAPTGDQEQADSSVDHRAPGGASTTLITAAQADTDLGLPTTTRLALDVDPDPDGGQLVVEAYLVATGAPAGALLVTRGGTLIATVPVSTDGPAFWSPSGRYLLATSSGHASVVDATGKVVTSYALPPSAQLLTSCVWSPDESQIACSAAAGSGDRVDTWLLINRRRSALTAQPQAGIPVLWTKN